MFANVWERCNQVQYIFCNSINIISLWTSKEDNAGEIQALEFKKKNLGRKEKDTYGIYPKEQ